MTESLVTYSELCQHPLLRDPVPLDSLGTE